MAIPTVITDLSATIASNSPAGGDQAFPNIDDYLRAAYGFIRQGDTKAANIASAGTTDLGAAVGRIVDVTGTTAITSFGTVAAGIWRIVRFTGALTLTHNATSLILPGGANITTAAGDACIAVSLGSGNWVVVSYQRASGAALTPTDTLTLASGTWTPTATAVTNVSSITPYECRYIRVGNIVSFAGAVFVYPENRNNASEFRLTTPINSAWTDQEQASGVISTGGVGADIPANGTIYCDTANPNEIVCSFGNPPSPYTNVGVFRFSGQYQIV